MSRRAVFLDRDGVLIEDVGMLTRRDDVHLYAETPRALKRLHGAGFAVVVITNQPVVARGLATEQDLRDIHMWIQQLLRSSGGAEIDRFYFCPHHPNADLPQYRADCQCRKPKPGLIIQAADEMDLDLPSSYMVGDRLSDVAAGVSAGCRTILLETGMHTAAPIESPEPSAEPATPDHVCRSVGEAADIIVGAE